MSIFFNGGNDTNMKKSAVIDLTALPKVKMFKLISSAERRGGQRTTFIPLGQLVKVRLY